MAHKKIKELKVKVGTYTDRNTGQEKGKYDEIGALMQSDDGSMFIMLKRTFNPAGVPGQDSRDSILVSAFDPQPRAGQQGGNQRSDDTPREQSGGSAGGYGAGGRAQSYGGPADMDDEIPFSMEWRA